MLFSDSIKPRGCDQCYWDLRRCNKELPVCFNCRKANRECTRNKLSKYRVINNNSKTQQIITNGQNNASTHNVLTSNSSANNVVKRNKFKIVDHNKLKTIPLKKPKSLNQSIWTSFLRMCFQDPTSRYKLYYFSRVLGISIQNSSESQRNTISKFVTGMELSSNYPKVPLHLHYHLNDIKYELRNATESYLLNSNVLFPIFPDNAFNLKPRSQFLKACVCRAGLHYMPKSVLRSEIIDSLDKIILNYIKISNLKPSLNYLQGILVVVFSCHSSPLVQYRSRLFSISVGLVHLLGLEYVTVKSCFVECQMSLSLIYGSDFYFSNPIGSMFLPRISLRSNTVHKISFLSLFLQKSSNIIYDAYIVLSDSKSDTGPEYIFYLLKRLDRLANAIIADLKKDRPKNLYVNVYYIDLTYHYYYTKLIDMLFELNHDALNKLKQPQISLLNKTGYVHAMMIIQKTIPLQSLAFVCSRLPFLLQASKILNSWAAPCPPCIYQLVRRNIMRTNHYPVQGQIDFALKLIDEYFKII